MYATTRSMARSILWNLCLALRASPLSFQAIVSCSTWAFLHLSTPPSSRAPCSANLALACLLSLRADPLANTSSLYHPFGHVSIFRHNCNSLRFEGFMSRPPTSGPQIVECGGRDSASFAPVSTFSREASLLQPVFIATSRIPVPSLVSLRWWRKSGHVWRTRESYHDWVVEGPSDLGVFKDPTAFVEHCGRCGQRKTLEAKWGSPRLLLLGQWCVVKGRTWLLAACMFCWPNIFPKSSPTVKADDSALRLFFRAQCIVQVQPQDG